METLSTVTFNKGISLSEDLNADPEIQWTRAWENVSSGMWISTGHVFEIKSTMKEAFQKSG